jgi:hypothetical protein
MHAVGRRSISSRRVYETLTSVCFSPPYKGIPTSPKGLMNLLLKTKNLQHGMVGGGQALSSIASRAVAVGSSIHDSGAPSRGG